MSRYAIEGQTMTNLADGVRWRTGSYEPMSTDELINGLKRDYGVNRDQTIDVLPEDEWTRPAAWPDLDSLNLEMSGDDFIYMTYDADKEASAIVWHIETADKQPATVDIGHIESGAYIVDESASVAHNTDYVRWTDDLSGYIVIRITGQLTRCYMIDAGQDGRTQNYRQQPVLERIAWVPHLTAFCTSYQINAWTPYTLEREKAANGEGTALTSLYYAWVHGKRLRSLDITGLHTPNVTNFTRCFYYCQYIKSFNLTHWETSKGTSFGYMFGSCYGLQRVDLTGWNTGNATVFEGIFSSCRSLREIYGLAEFDTAKATNLASMFTDCCCLKNMPVQGWKTGNVTTTYGMFSGCHELKELDLSGWDVSRLTAIGYMFSNCQALKRVNFDGWQTGEITTAASLFTSCHCLESVDVSWLHLTNKCTNIYNMFGGCWLLKELDIPDDWDLSGISSANNTANNVFSNCYSLERITGIQNWQFSFTNSLTSMFSGCRSLKELDVSGWKTDTVTSLSNMFSGCYSLERVDVSGWSTDNCTTLASMFNGCWSLKSIGDISGWNTSKVTTFASMFFECMSLTEMPDVSGWDFSKATTVASMFGTMRSIREITLNNINLAVCTTAATMFRYCTGLQKVTLTGWSIPKMTTAPAQFLGDCVDLRDVVIDIPFTLAHSYANCDALSYESVMNIINGLPTLTGTRNLTLPAASYNRLTEAERQAAKGKGWNIVSG